MTLTVTQSYILFYIHYLYKREFLGAGHSNDWKTLSSTSKYLACQSRFFLFDQLMTVSISSREERIKIWRVNFWESKGTVDSSPCTQTIQTSSRCEKQENATLDVGILLDTAHTACWREIENQVRRILICIQVWILNWFLMISKWL